MRKKFSLLVVALCAMTCFSSLQAKDPDPYQNVLESGQFTTFSPADSYSLQVRFEVGDSIEVRNASGKGFVYKATKPGVFSFLVDLTAGTVQVYWGSELQTETPKLTVSPVPVSLGGDDLVNAELQDESLKLGIYKNTNLFKNPGFEKVTYYEGYTTDNKTDQRGKPDNWAVFEKFNTATSCRANNIPVNAGYANIVSLTEGAFCFMLHNVETPLWQKLAPGTLKPSTWYKVSYRQMAHKDTSIPATYLSYLAKDSANAAADRSNVITSHSYISAKEGLGNYLDVTYGFKTPETLPADLYYAIKRISGPCINHFDRMTMQELKADEVRFYGLVSKAEQATWQEGLQIPTGGESETYEDVTATYLANPSFENTKVTEAAHSFPNGVNGGVWIPEGWMGDCAVAETNTQGLITTGNMFGSAGTPTGFSPVDGTHFYYYRVKWAADSFTLSQTMKNLSPGTYDLTFSAAADTKMPATMTLSGATDKKVTIAEPVFKTYSISFNVVNPSDVTITAFVTRTIKDTECRLVLDNFKLIYRGNVDQDAAIQELMDAADALAEKWGAYDQGSLPSGVNADANAAAELYDTAQGDPTFENWTAAVAAYKKAVVGAEECGDLYQVLVRKFEKGGIDLEKGLPGAPEYKKAVDAAQFVLAGEDGFSNVVLYYAADLKTAIEKLAAATRVYYLTGFVNATETTPVDFTNIIVCPDFTKEDGDISLAADAVRTGWMTANNPSTGGDYKLNTVNGRNCWNNWNNSFVSMDVYQELTGMPEGMYSVKCVTTTNGIPTDQHAYVMTSAGTTESPAATYQYTGSAFATESEWEALSTGKVYLPKGGVLRIGMASTSGGDTKGWFCVTGFELSYFKAPEGAGKEALIQKVAIAQSLIDTADVKIMGVEEAMLKAAILTGNEAMNSEAIGAAYQVLDVAIDTAKYSIKLYDGMFPVLTQAKSALTEGGYSVAAVEALKKVVNEQEAVLSAATTSCADIAGVQVALEDAMLEFRFSKIEQATPENPVDLTFMLVNPTVNASGTKAVPDGWTATKMGGNENFTGNGQHWSGVTNYYIDSYGDPGKLKYTVQQTVIGVPNGTYTLKCTGRSSGVGAYLFAMPGDTLIAEIDTCYDKGGKIWENAAPGSPEALVHEGIGYGWNWITLTDIVVWNNALTVGVTTDPSVSGGKTWTGSWFSADDFQLLCTSPNWNVGVEDVNADQRAKLNVYVENGYVKVEGVEEFTITTSSGAQLRSDAQLVPGFYIVTAEGQSVKIAVK